LIFQDTIRRLKNIKAAIELALVPPTQPGAPDPYLQSLSTIYGEAKLEHDLVFFNVRLTRSIRFVLMTLLMNGQAGVDEATAAQLLAAEDIIRELTAISPSGSLSLILQDLDNAQRILESTARSTAVVYSNNINQILKEYSDRAARPGSTAQKYKNGLAQLNQCN
jgi:hypothetical protein